jgi:transcriptional regulator with XRE-family HTH domain
VTITGEQVARARYLLGLSRIDLAGKAHLSETTIGNCENGKRPVKPSSVMAIRAALESAGVEFIAENGGGAGVRLKKPQ